MRNLSNSLCRFACVVAFVGALAGVAQGRGFGGGFHGGGGGGGFHGGNFGGGGGFDRGGFGGGGGFDRGGFGGGGDHGNFGGGNFDRGGFNGGSFDRGNFGGGNFDRGGFNNGFNGARAGEFGGAAPSRGELNSFLGLPTDGGFHAGGSTFATRGGEGNFGAAAGQGAASGHIYHGPNGGEVAHGSVAGRGAAVGPNGAAAGRGAASGTIAKGPNGGVYAHGRAAGEGISTNGRFSPTAFHAQGLSAQRWYNGRGWFTPGWIGNHPWAWCPGRYAAGAWATAAWAACSWNSLGSWLAWDASPSYYLYGDNVTYQDGNVYYGDQYEASAQDYYQQASNMAGAGAAAPADDAEWLPLGVFAVLEGEQTNPLMTIQLAANKQGILRGNSIDAVTQKMTVIAGSIDKKTQRAAWTIGDDKSTVFETGVYNLTKQEAPGLVHFGADRTEQMLLTRLKQDDQQTASSN